MYQLYESKANECIVLWNCSKINGFLSSVSTKVGNTFIIHYSKQMQGNINTGEIQYKYVIYFVSIT